MSIRPPCGAAGSFADCAVGKWTIGLVLSAAILAAVACSPTAPVATPPDAAARAPVATSADPAIRNVILISIDTLRADHLGAYGYRPPTSPNLDAFAKRATRFTDCEAASAHTLASHKSLLSGRHAASFLASFVERGGPRRPTPVPLDYYRLAFALWSSPSLAQHLEEAGFATCGLTDGGFVRSLYGFSRGFEVYEDARVGLGAHCRVAEAWIASHQETRFFLFLHCYDVHCPYDPPRRFLQMFENRCDGDLQFAGACGKTYFNKRLMTDAQVAHLRRHYDAGIRHADEELGAFLEFLRRTGRFEDTMVIVTSDHGESLGEHGFVGHGELSENQLRVPLIIHVPGGKGSVVTAPVSGVDVLPTILDATLGRIPPGLDGWSLREFLEPGRATGPQAERHERAFLPGEWEVSRSLQAPLGIDREKDRVLSERQEEQAPYAVRAFEKRPRFASVALGEDRGDIACLRKIAVLDTGGFKLIHDVETGRSVLFDLASDPGEDHDLAGSGHPQEPRLRALALAQDPGSLRGLDPRAAPRPETESLTPEIREELRSLGYVN